jgi:hypothetical protein
MTPPRWFLFLMIKVFPWTCVGIVILGTIYMEIFK